jgi:endonuclease YncB( thermonuclease family)
MVRTATILLASIGFLAAPATAAEITGPVRVIDGDTLDLAGTRIPLWGIDAPETRQTCEGRDGQT